MTVTATAAPTCITLNTAVHPHSKVTFALLTLGLRSSASALKIFGSISSE